MKLDILKIPDRTLREPSEPIETVDDDVRHLLNAMLETMYDAPGIGLAAPQVGILKRVVTIDVSPRSEDPQEAKKPEPFLMVNPKVVWSSDTPSVYEEGCLSIPDYYAEVERPDSVIVQYLDFDGKEQEIKAEGLLATCVQHEIDHLDGVLFIDYLSKLKRDRVIKKFAKIKKLAAS